MIVRLPFPPSALMPNAKNGRHWATHQKAKVQARNDGHYAARAAMGDWKPQAGNIPVSIVFLQPDARRRDADGLLGAAKHYLDGIAQAIGVDDQSFRPLLIDVVSGGKAPGASIVALGVTITTSMELNA